MSNDRILKEILKDEVLKDKYWKDVNVDNENIRTASMHKNKSIKLLATLLNNDSKSNKVKNIKNIYNL
jgi:hypothetical protein